MGFENLKRWHWIVIGVIVGLLIAYVRVQVDPPQHRSGSQADFENFISQTHTVGVDGKQVERPMIKDVVIHPPLAADEAAYKKAVQTVTYLKDDVTTVNGVKGWQYQLSSFHVDLPFTPNGSSEYGGSFLKYMQQQAKNDPNIKFSYAWWEEPKAQFAMWTVGCAVVIGGLWPTVINVLIGAGFARPKKEKAYDLDRFGKYKEEEKKVAPKVMSAEEQEQLARVNATLEKELAPSGNRMTVGVGANQPGDQPVKKLDGKELEIANIEKEEEDKEYKGEFYPVARPVHQQHDGPEHKG